MPANLTLYCEIALTALLAVTLVYCIVLERRLASVRKGQEGLKSTIADLNNAIAGAGASLRALKSAAAGAAELLDERLTRARGAADELALIGASSERIAERMERASAVQPGPRAAVPASNLPSGSIMGRLDALKAVR
jgi:hypothetical protein